ncbi:MAG: hypothetical protein MZU91_08305 [Desulfosudis oleivorans]|nr:hypothetical protein [Desulfosudis oleivorans]
MRAAKLPAAIEKTVQAMIAEAEDMRRQEASKIIVTRPIGKARHWKKQLN